MLAEEQVNSQMRDKSFQAAIAYISMHGWSEASLVKIAQESNIATEEFYKYFPSKFNILDELFTRIDMQTLANVEKFNPADTSEEKLFAVLMGRFDSMRPYKEVIRKLWYDSLSEPILLLSSAPKGLTSLNWMLELADIHLTGWGGAMKLKLFALLYLSEIKVWLEDDSEDMAKTMSSLAQGIEKFTFI